MSYIPVQYVQSCSKYVSSNFSRFDASTFNKNNNYSIADWYNRTFNSTLSRTCFCIVQMCSFITLPVTFLRLFNFFVLIRLLPVKLKGTLSLSLSKPFCYGLVIDLKLALQLYSESRNYKSSSSLFRAVLTIA